MSNDLLSSLIPFFGCIIKHTPEGARLTGASQNHLKPRANFFQYRLRFGFNLRHGLILNRMCDVNGVVIGPPQRAGLRARGGHEFVRSHGQRRDAKIFQPCDIVQTARCA